ncbi:MAG TPA: hypothetical protein VHJ83_11430, partial [Micromonosporaceae bacterium]|nr:hypothetical protein [Micromonosporaceae bacterium]
MTYGQHGGTFEPDLPTGPPSASPLGTPSSGASYPPPPPPPAGRASGYPMLPYDPLVAYDFSSWVSRVVEVVKRSGTRLLVLLTMGYLLPLAILAGFAVSMIFGSLMVGLAVPSVVLAFYLRMVADLAVVNVATNDAAGQPVRLRDAYRSCLRLGWPTLGWSILAGLVTFLGFLMCIL